MPPKIPCSVAQGISLQTIEFARRLDAKIVAEGPDFAKFPVNFPFSGNSGLETGPIWTASSANV